MSQEPDGAAEGLQIVIDVLPTGDLRWRTTKPMTGLALERVFLTALTHLQRELLAARVVAAMEEARRAPLIVHGRPQPGFPDGRG